MSTKEIEAYNNKRLLASQLIGIIAGGIANGDKGANTGYKITTSADTYNRQLHQREIDFINNKNNIESFKSKLQTTTNKIYSDDEAKSILAKAAVSLTDRSFNETYRQSLSSNDLYNIELATNFIKQSSFYNTSLDNTNAFNPDKKQYEDRYVYLDSFTNNREFYDKNLKVDTKLSDDIANFATGFAKGGINLVKDTITGVYYLVTDTKETAKGIANTLSNADTLIYNGFMKSELDTVLGDYESVTARDTEFIAGLTGSGAITNKAGKAALDRVGKKSSEATSDITKIDNPAIEAVKDKDSAANVALYEKYKKELYFLEIFNSDGTLTENAIKASKIINSSSGEKIGNKKLIAELSKRGDIKDWVKAKVKVGKDEVHFYKNLKTNEVYYEMDYKTKFGGKK